MPVAAIECPHCGFDFPSVDTLTAGRESGFAYSALADTALIISTFTFAMGAGVSLFWTFAMLFNGQIVISLTYGPLAFFLQLGLVVVFLRVQQ